MIEKIYTEYINAYFINISKRNKKIEKTELASEFHNMWNFYAHMMMIFLKESPFFSG